MFRSEEMQYYNLIIPNEEVWDILNELGTIGYIQFDDINRSDPNGRPKKIL